MSAHSLAELLLLQRRERTRRIRVPLMEDLREVMIVSMYATICVSPLAGRIAYFARINVVCGVIPPML